jgi:hypothetical protein
VLLAVMFKWGLELDIAEQQGTVRVSELERSVAELQKFPVPVDDWRVTEVKAISRLVEQTDLESPPWAEVLHELGHITSKPVRFDALTLSKGGVAPLPAKPAGRAAARKAAAKPKPTPAATGAPDAKGSDTPSTAWVLAVSGTVSGASFPQLQETFRAWYEDAVVSPYLARMDIASAEIGKRTPTANRGATPAMARRRVEMTTGAVEPPSPESVLRFEVKSEVLTSDAVRSVVSSLDAKGGEGP